MLRYEYLYRCLIVLSVSLVLAPTQFLLATDVCATRPCCDGQLVCSGYWSSDDDPEQRDEGVPSIEQEPDESLPECYGWTDGSWDELYAHAGAQGYPAVSKDTDTPYSSFRVAASHTGVYKLFTLKFKDDDGEPCSPTPAKQFRVMGTRKIHLQTQGNPSDYNPATQSTAAVSAAGSIGISGSNQKCAETSECDVDISKTENTPQTFGATVTWPPEVSWSITWNNEYWFTDSEKFKEILCLFSNASDGARCGSDAVHYAVRMSASAMARAGGSTSFPWGAKAEITVYIEGFSFEPLQ